MILHLRERVLALPEFQETKDLLFRLKAARTLENQEEELSQIEEVLVVLERIAQCQ